MIHLNFHVLLDTGIESRKQLPVVREERTIHTSVCTRHRFRKYLNGSFLLYPSTALTSGEEKT